MISASRPTVSRRKKFALLHVCRSSQNDKRILVLGIFVTNFSSVPPEIGSEHGKSVFLLLFKIKAVPSLEAQKDMVKWVLQVGYFDTFYFAFLLHIRYYYFRIYLCSFYLYFLFQYFFC